MQLQYRYVHVGNAYPVHVPYVHVQQRQSMYAVNHGKHVAPLDSITGTQFVHLSSRLTVVNTVKSTLPLR